MNKLIILSSLLLLGSVYQPSSAFAVPVLSSELTSAVAKINSGEKGSKGTVLVVISAADSIPLQNGKSHKTGYFLRELTDPLKEVVLAGYDVEFATPGGKTPTVDVNSLKPAWYGFPTPIEAEKKLNEAVALKNSIDFLNGKRAPKSLDEAYKKVGNYVGLIVPGGHAPMVDLRYDLKLGAIIRHFHETRTPMVFVCHGPIALLSAGTEGGWPFAGYRISVVSTADENLLESNMISWLIGPIEGKLAEYPDQALQQAGAVLSISPVAGTPSFSKDREVITAQNPAAATAVGKILVRSIAERQGKRRSDPPVEGIAPNLTIADLAQMKREALAALYSQGTANEIPLGDTVGLGLVFSGAAQLNYLSAYVWQGKIFKETENGVILANKIFGYPRKNGYQVDAQVKIANSLFDGKPALQLDYSSSDAIPARPIIDEIRKVGAHLYLGRITFQGQDLGFFSLYFVE